jgi:hypothetical protein
MRDLFTRYVVTHRPEGAVGAVADLLAEGTLSRVTFDAVVAEYGVEHDRGFRDGLLDLVLHAARDAVRDHALSGDEVDLLRQLTVTFRVREGEFVARRRADVAAVLQGEVHRLLADDVVDGSEAAYAEQLQRVFGLGYDEYLALVRDAFTPAVERALARAAAGTWDGAPERARFERALAALRTAYVLSPAQRRALGVA